MEKKLYEALQMIRQECASHKEWCYGCPLNVVPNSGCLIGETDQNPEDWDMELLKGEES